jgi:hypothetical protein
VPKVLKDGFLTYRLFDLPLRLNIKRIGIKALYLSQPLLFAKESMGVYFPQELSKPLRI